MNLTQRFADSYHAVTVKGAWYGPALAELLAEITPELATTPPAPGAHSISTLLQHLLLWNERVRNAADGISMPKFEAEKEWAQPAIPWDQLVPRWSESRNRLEERIRSFPIEDLAKTVPGRTYSFETVFGGIVHHTIYHSGQIAMVLSMLRRSRP